MVTLPLAAQSVYLRYGGPMSRLTIRAASNSTPIEITTTEPHGYAEGDIVWISQVRGNYAANGVRRVKNPGERTFSITDLNGNDVAGSGPYLDSGFVGQARETSLAAHPRIMAEGPGGAVTRRILDPDGPGGQTAQNAVRGWAPYDVLSSRMDSRARNPNSYYGGNTQTTDSNEVQNGEGVHQMALAWSMDHSKSNYLTTAKQWINDFHKLFVWPNFTVIDPNDRSYGLGSASYLDWGSFYAANWAMAYTLLRSELSPAERRAFANKMLNDVSDNCTEHIGYGEGTVSVAVNSTRVTGQGTRFTMLKPGQFIRIPNAATFQRWVKIASIESDTELTTAAAAITSTPPVENGRWFYAQEYVDTACGVKWWLNHHSYTPSSPMMQWRVEGRLAEPVDQTATTIKVRNPADLSIFRLPFYGQLTGSPANNYAIERLKVTAVNGDELTVVRGERGSQANTGNVNRLVYFHQYPLHSNLMTNNVQWTRLDDPRHNLTMTKIYGYLIVGAALCGEDERACRLLEETWNYFYDFMYPYMKDFWTGINQGGYSYGPPRWGEWSMTIAHMAKSTFQPPIDISDGQWLRSWLHHGVYMTLPYNPAYGFRYGDSGGSQEMNAQQYRGVFTGIHLFPESPEAGHALHWFRDEAKWFTAQSFNSSTGYRGIAWPLYFITPQSPAVDYKATAKPHRFFTETDTDWKEDPTKGPKTGFFGVVSRSNWKPTATHLWVSSFSRPTDHLCVWSAAGHYYILKNQYLIANQGQGTLTPGCMSGGGAGTNYVEIGGSPSNLPTTYENELGGIGPVPPVDKTYAGTNYLLARVDAKTAQRVEMRVTRLFRTFVHLRNGDQQDYIIVHDDAATARARQKRIRMWHFSDANEEGSLTKTGPTTWEFKRARAKVTSMWLMPSAPEKFTELAPVSYRGSTGQTEWSKGYMVDDAESMETGFLVVHRPTDDLNAPMPAVEMLRDVSEGALGVAIDDKAPRTVILQKNGEVPLATVSFQTRAYSGNGVVVVTGLIPGTYAVLRDGLTLKSDIQVAEHGSLEVMGPAGGYTVTRTGGPRAMLQLRPSGLSFLHRVGSQPPDPQQVRVTCLGCRVKAETSEPWCTVSPRESLAPFSASVGVLPSGFQAGRYTCTVRFSAEQAENSPASLEALVTVSEVNSIRITPSRLDYEITMGDPAPEPQKLVAECSQPCSLAVTTNQDWCGVDPMSGESPLEFKVSINVEGLEPGEHECSISASTPDVPDAAVASLVVTVLQPPPSEPPDGDGFSRRLRGFR
jgi:hypothetical protein